MENGLHILIVDDNPLNQTSLKRVLSEILHGRDIPAVIDIAADGQQAVDMVQESIAKQHKSFNIIFMDYQMPKLNGQSATLAIRQLENKTLTNTLSKSYIITWSSVWNHPYSEADTVLIKDSITRTAVSAVLEEYWHLLQ